MRTIVWAVAARNDLRGIRGYINNFNPIAARQLAEAALNAADSLADLAERGRPIGRNRRELAVVHPYVIRYRIKGQIVEIMRVRHGKQKPLK